MGNCCSVVPFAGPGEGEATELGSMETSMRRALEKSSTGSGSSLSCDSMEFHDRRETGRMNAAVGGSQEQARAPPFQPDYTEIQKQIEERGTLSYGAAKVTTSRNSRDRTDSYEDKMPLQTLNFRRGTTLGASEAEDMDMELGEDSSSQLGFARVLEQWQEDRKAVKSSRKGLLSLFASSKNKKKGGKPKKEEKPMMWETFLESKKVETTNPAWRHSKQVYNSDKFKEKVEYMFASIDTNGVGFLEKHEFMFMVDGLRGRMHHFLRNTRALYFTQSQDEVLPSDQEFVLSDDFKDSLVVAIQDQLFTWRMTSHAWAVDKDLFENLVTLIFCSTVYLIMTDEEKSLKDVPVAVEFYLLMSSEGMCVPVEAALIKSASRSSDGDLDSMANSLFCKAIFSLHMICPPQSLTYVDETVMEVSGEEEEEGQ
ncbi:EF-hand domain-containing protein [Chloropicon primus]|uniref:EF-hand domain-containing protein n=2 Tax=Chloropicon primus TaxID=1764295 RepID=A0A5B8MV12_9CHLO|nr:hypothetical protein A3770_13p69310 [Chloropicon primus]UPR03621.1 EF-hand domain-containing protein [Chloropicon primus]|eukprot:QDZ24413.1 hypothetical protein A3770_13p69310 [Chloropicon primus]